jgi:hypothetical protein
MHSIHYGSAMFLYQAFERRPAQETLIGCAGLHNIKILKALNIHPVCVYSCLGVFGTPESSFNY